MSSRLFFKFSVKRYFNYPCPRKLREIVKLSLFEKENPQTIAAIWDEYHKEKRNTTSFTLDSDLYNTLMKK